MPKKEWIVFFREFQLLVRRRTENGEVLSFAIVLLAQHKGHWIDVSRYDTAHGYPHRDVLGLKEGLRGKLRMVTLNRKQCFRYAIRDLTENAENYLEDFLAH